jgi:adenylate kinase family enzyme
MDVYVGLFYTRSREKLQITVGVGTPISIAEMLARMWSNLVRIELLLDIDVPLALTIFEFLEAAF